MASPVIPLPTSRSASRSRGIQKSPNPSRRDKVRQGKLIRCWTDEEETFLLRSRTQSQKLSYKHIAKRLDKSELACRLHYHHMTVGRKGHRADDEDDELSEHSDSSAPSTVPPIGELPGYRGIGDVDYRRSVSTDTLPNQNQLPNFQAFLRGISHHQRSTSMPGAVHKGNADTLGDDDQRVQTYRCTALSSTAEPVYDPNITASTVITSVSPPIHIQGHDGFAVPDFIVWLPTLTGF
ncbi:hypothetical protein H2200_009656 [Cladophialophora chaetospira]|uniref:Myb-like domain-containing protein n=1 Tax=Cladophialophora chaetospira TaxID=386627 RepID=A0AA38X364_9EURO|nr:hypothetical protein H2200_009656 [Cladophialophora chaetospira]